MGMVRYSTPLVISHHHYSTPSYPITIKLRNEPQNPITQASSLVVFGIWHPISLSPFPHSNAISDSMVEFGEAEGGADTTPDPMNGGLVLLNWPSLKL